MRCPCGQYDLNLTSANLCHCFRRWRSCAQPPEGERHHHCARHLAPLLGWGCSGAASGLEERSFVHGWGEKAIKAALGDSLRLLCRCVIRVSSWIVLVHPWIALFRVMGRCLEGFCGRDRAPSRLSRLYSSNSGLCNGSARASSVYSLAVPAFVTHLAASPLLL